jgi:hypothetical protein
LGVRQRVRVDTIRPARGGSSRWLIPPSLRARPRSRATRRERWKPRDQVRVGRAGHLRRARRIVLRRRSPEAHEHRTRWIARNQAARQYKQANATTNFCRNWLRVGGYAQENPRRALPLHGTAGCGRRPQGTWIAPVGPAKSNRLAVTRRNENGASENGLREHARAERPLEQLLMWRPVRHGDRRPPGQATGHGLVISDCDNTDGRLRFALTRERRPETRRATRRAGVSKCRSRARKRGHHGHRPHTRRTNRYLNAHHLPSHDTAHCWTRTLQTAALPRGRPLLLLCSA